MGWNDLKTRVLYSLSEGLLALAQSILGKLQLEEPDGLGGRIGSDNTQESPRSDRGERTASNYVEDGEKQNVSGPPAHWVERVRKAAPELLRSPERGRVKTLRELYQPETSKESTHQVRSSEVTGEPSSTRDDEGSELIHQSANAYMSMARPSTRPSGSKTEETREFDDRSHSNAESVHEVSILPDKQDIPDAPGHVNNIVAKQTLRTTPGAIPEQEEPVPSMTDSGKAPQPDAFFPALNLPNTQTSLPTSDLSQLSDYDIPTRYSTTSGISPLQNSAEDSQVPTEGVWPELPEAPSSGTSDEVAMALSEVERLRRLDREQRGTLWSE
jgi:hypothetical protein